MMLCPYAFDSFQSLSKDATQTKRGYSSGEGKRFDLPASTEKLRYEPQLKAAFNLACCSAAPGRFFGSDLPVVFGADIFMSFFTLLLTAACHALKSAHRS